MAGVESKNFIPLEVSSDARDLIHEIPVSSGSSTIVGVAILPGDDLSVIYSPALRVTIPLGENSQVGPDTQGSSASQRATTRASEREQLEARLFAILTEVRLGSPGYDTPELGGHHLVECGTGIIPILRAELEKSEVSPEICRVKSWHIPAIVCAIRELGDSAAPLAVDLVDRMPLRGSTRGQQAGLERFVFDNLLPITTAINDELRIRFDKPHPSLGLLRFVEGMPGFDVRVLDGVPRQLVQIDQATYDPSRDDGYYCVLLQCLKGHQFEIDGATKAFQHIVETLSYGDALVVALAAVAEQDGGIRHLERKLASDFHSDILRNSVSSSIPLFDRSELVEMFKRSPDLLFRCANLHYLGACGAEVKEVLPLLHEHLDRVKKIRDEDARKVHLIMIRRCIRDIETDAGFASRSGRKVALSWLGPNPFDTNQEQCSYDFSNSAELKCRIRERVDYWRRNSFGASLPRLLNLTAEVSGKSADSAPPDFFVRAKRWAADTISSIWRSKNQNRSRPELQLEELPGRSGEDLEPRPQYDFRKCTIFRDAQGNFEIDAQAISIDETVGSILGDFLPADILLETTKMSWSVGSDGAVKPHPSPRRLQVKHERALFDLLAQLSRIRE